MATQPLKLVYLFKLVTGPLLKMATQPLKLVYLFKLSHWAFTQNGHSALKLVLLRRSCHVLSNRHATQKTVNTCTFRLFSHL